jgi:hypothetical protein
MFIGTQRFSFWGGMVGIGAEDQQALCSALGKAGDEIFPLRFTADPGLATGIVSGQVDGFYRSTHAGLQVETVGPDKLRAFSNSSLSTILQVSARSNSGYPQPQDQYKKLMYEGACQRCGIYGRQVEPFRFKKSGRSMPSGFSQLNWVFDAFFVSPDIASEIIKAGITGVSFGPVLDHRTGAELNDRLQLLISTILPSAETTQLPTVTCRPNNEEEVSLTAKGWGNFVSGAEAKLAGIPHCGRVKYHVPTSLAINQGTVTDAPDLFQTAEWFGSGGLAYRLTLASDRFVALVRERGWRGLVFYSTQQGGWSERT